MISIYLWINAALYAVFALMCALGLDKTSDGLGYKVLSAGGRSEYVVVYGALQLGLALFFAYTAIPSNGAARAGLMLALAMYLPIVIVRWATVLSFDVTSPVTIGTGILESVLLVGGVFVWMRAS